MNYLNEAGYFKDKYGKMRLVGLLEGESGNYTCICTSPIKSMSIDSKSDLSIDTVNIVTQSDSVYSVRELFTSEEYVVYAKKLGIDIHGLLQRFRVFNPVVDSEELLDEGIELGGEKKGIGEIIEDILVFIFCGMLISAIFLVATTSFSNLLNSIIS